MRSAWPGATSTRISALEPRAVSAARKARTPDSCEQMTSTGFLELELRSTAASPARRTARAASAMVFPEPGGPVTSSTASAGAPAMESLAGIDRAPTSARKDALAVGRALATGARIRAVRARRIDTGAEMLDAHLREGVRAREQLADRGLHVGGRARAAHQPGARRPLDHRVALGIQHVERQHPHGVARIAQRDQRQSSDAVAAHAAHRVIERKLRLFTATDLGHVFLRVFVDAPRLVVVDRHRTAAGGPVDAIDKADELVTAHRPALQRLHRLDRKS